MNIKNEEILDIEVVEIYDKIFKNEKIINEEEKKNFELINITNEKK